MSAKSSSATRRGFLSTSAAGGVTTRLWYRDPRRPTYIREEDGNRDRFHCLLQSWVPGFTPAGYRREVALAYADPAHRAAFIGGLRKVGWDG